MKLCTRCNQEFDDELNECPDDGTPLVQPGVALNQKLPGVRTVDASATTRMVTMEELEKESKRIEASDGMTDELPEPDENKTGALDRSMLPVDRDSTRAITPEDLARMRAEHEARRGGGTPAPIPDDAKTTPDKTAIRERKKGPTPEEKERSRKRAMMLVIVGLVLVLIGGGAAVYVLFLRKLTLEVVTAPPGAMVFVDGVEIGPSPTSTGVKPGAHAVRATLEGYAESNEVITVEGGKKSVVLTMQKSADQPAAATTTTTTDDPPKEDPIKAKADALYKEARALLEAGRLDEAEIKFQALAALVPDDPRAAEGLVEINARRAKGGRKGGKRAGGGDGDGADEYSRLKPAERKRMAQKNLDQARTAYDLGEMEKAKELLTRCLRYFPGQVQCHRVLARVYTKEDNTPKVKYHLQRYLELGGSDEDYKVRDWLRSH